MMPELLKSSALRSDVELQEHQRRVAEGEKPIRKLLVHALGSGKSFTSIAASEAFGKPYTAVVPASLRPNYKKEQERFSDGKLPSAVMSYTELGADKPIPHPDSLVFDEAHRLRNQDSLQTLKAMTAADKAQQVLLLSGSPIVNRPGDLATPINMLTGSFLTPDEFESKYVGTKTRYPSLFHRILRMGGKPELTVNNEEELRERLHGRVDWHAPNKPVVPTRHEDVAVDMGPEQVRLYKAMWDKLPWHVKWKLQNEVNLSPEDLHRTISFLTGPRQAGLSTFNYMKERDPLKAFGQSTKLQAAHGRLQEKLKDPRVKALVFSNFIDAGLTPYQAALTRDKIPAAVFHGGLTDADRKKIVEDYNTGKLRVALLGPSGTEGLSFKGTQLVQLLDPYWNPVRPNQSVGRALRYDSHLGLPEDLQHVQVQRFLSRLPLGTWDRALSHLGFDRSQAGKATDEHLVEIARKKEELNRRFLELLKNIGMEGH